MANEMTTGLAPYLHIKDGRAAEAVEFYKKAFGAEVVTHMLADDGERIMHVTLTVNGSHLMLSDVFPEFSESKVRDIGGFDLHLQVDDADTWFDRAVAAGCTVRMPLADQFWGDRYGAVRDPFGVDWSIAATIKQS